MKVLLLLSGYTCKRVSWEKGDNGTPKKDNMEHFFSGVKYLNRLLKNHEVKTIACLWDEIGSAQVKKFYDPEILISLNQEEFQENLSTKLGDYENKRMKKRSEWFEKKNIKNDLVISAARFASQLYGRQMVSKKALEYINNQKFIPDLILLTRYDISCRGGALIRNPARISSQIEYFLSKDKSKPKIVLPLFNQLNAGFPDMWFYLNFSGLVIMQNIYDEYLYSLTNKDSKYKKLLTEGWPFSEFFELSDIDDPKQFTNIILSKNQSNNLMKYQDWELPNIHAFLKYFLILRSTKFKIKFVKRFDSLYSMILYGNFKTYFLLSFKEIVYALWSKLRRFL